MLKTYTYIVTIALFALLPLLSTGQVQVRVSPDFKDSFLCKGGNFNLLFVVDSDFYYSDTNIFKIQLSDAYGSFSSPTTIGQAGGTDDGTIVCTIPSSTQLGSGYRVRVTSTSPAEISANNGKDLRISAYPTAVANNDGPICPTSTLHLTGTSNAAAPLYNWKGPNNYTSNLQNPTFVNPPVTASGPYILAVTNYGCTTKDTTDVRVVNPPEARIIPAGPVHICIGTALTLDANDTTNTPGVVFTWKGPGNFIQNNYVFQRYNADTSFAGTYVVTLAVGNCITTDSVIVYVEKKPDTPTATSNTPVCVSDTLRLYASSTSPGVTYEWRGPNFFSTAKNPVIPISTLKDSGLYTVTTAFANTGCKSAEAKTQVVIGKQLPAPIINGNVPLCAGHSLSLTAIGINIGLGTFTWTKPGGDTVLGKTIGLSNITKADAGRYSVIQRFDGCVSPPGSTYVIIREVLAPVITSNSPICDGSALNLNASLIDSATYIWTGPDNFTDTNRNVVIPAAGLSKGGAYYVAVKVANCGNGSSMLTVVNPIPVITKISSNSPVCDQDTLSMNATTDISNSKFVWKWPDGSTTEQQNIQVESHKNIEGSFVVTASANNCVSKEFKTDVTVNDLPAIPVISSNSPVKEGETLELSATCATPDVVFAWRGVNGFKASSKDTFIKDVTVDNAGTYYVSAISKDGCDISALSIITVLSNPNSVLNLYPNPGDGLITLKGLVQTKNHATVQIFNLSGQAIYSEKVLPVNKKIEKTIDLRGVASGVYLMHIKTEKESLEIKFAVN